MTAELDPTIRANITSLDGINSHDLSPAGVLKMTQWDGPKNINESRIPKRLLADGSSLIQASATAAAKLRDLAPGSIIGVAATKQKDLETVNAALIEKYETLAIVVEHTAQGTLLFGVVRQPRPTEQHQGAWGKYRVGESLYDEKDDAVKTLTRLFHPQKGIEATQMLSSIFSLAGGQGDVRITEMGCFSHEQPKTAIPQNFLLGENRVVPPILIDGKNPTQVLRVFTDEQGVRLRPLATSSDTLNESSLLAKAYSAKAHQIAAENPKGMGAGTSPEHVLEALFETTLTVAEVAGNGGTIAQGRQILRGRLGVR